jgi:hypothetical protein
MSGSLFDQQKKQTFQQLAGSAVSQVLGTQAPLTSSVQPASDGGGGISGAIGEGAHVIGNILGATNKYLAKPILGGISRVEYSKPVWEGLGLRHISSTPEEQAHQIRTADSLTHAYKARAKTMNFGEKLLAEVIADPTTWATGGVGEALAGSESAAKFLGPTNQLRVQLGQDVLNRIQGAPIEGPLKAAKFLLTKSRALKPGEKAAFQLERRTLPGVAEEALGKGATTLDVFHLRGSLLKRQTEQLRGIINDYASNPATASEAENLIEVSSGSGRAVDVRQLSDLFEKMESTEPAYPIVRDEMISRGYLVPQYTPASVTMSGIYNQSQPLTMSAPGIGDAVLKLQSGDPTWIGHLTKTNAAGQPRIQLNKVKTIWEHMQTLPDPKVMDPQNLVQQFLDSSGHRISTAASTNYIKTPQLTHDLIHGFNFQARREQVAAAQNTITGAVQERAQAVGNAPYAQAVTQMLLENVGGENPTHFQAAILFRDPRFQPILDRAISAATPEEARNATGELLTTLNQRNSAFGVVHPWGWKQINRLLPKTSRNIDPTIVGGAGVDVLGGIINDNGIRTLEQARALPEITKFNQAWADQYNEIRTILDKYTTNPLNDMTSAQDLWNYVDNGVITDAQDAAKVKRFLKTYEMTPEAVQKTNALAQRLRRPSNITDLSKLTLQQAYLSNLMDAHFADLAVKYGINQKNFDASLARTMGNWIPRAWREQALLSPRYHIMNVMDMTVKSLLHGVNPLKLAGSSTQLAADLGQQHPPASVLMRGDIYSDPSSPIAALSQGVINSVPGAPAPPPSTFRGVLNAVRSVGPHDPTTALGQIGANNEGGVLNAIGNVGDRVGLLNKKSAHFIEDNFRLSAWRAQTVDALQNAKFSFLNTIKQIEPGRAGVDAATALEKLGDKNLGTLGINYSPEVVYDSLIRHGGSAESASKAASLWSNLVNQASQQGADLANKVHFNFDQTYAFEEALHLRTWLPFHFFATRNLPFYLETVAANPQLLHLMYDYHQLSADEKNQLGLPDTINNMVSAGHDSFLNLLFGPGRIMVNPLVAIALMDQTKNINQAFDPSIPNQGSGILGKVGGLNTRLQAVGMGLAPWVNIPLDVLGGLTGGSAYGPGNEQSDVIRLSAPIGALTNFAARAVGHPNTRISPDATLIQPALNRIREITTGTKRETNTGTLREDRAIADRIAEMSVEQTGQARNPDYIAASKDPTSSIYQQARQQVEAQMNRDALLGMVNPFPTKRVTDVKQAQTNALSQLGLTQDSLYAQDPAMQAVAQALRNSGSLATAYQSFGRPQILDTATGNPIYNGKISRSGGKGSGDTSYQNYTWGAGIWGPDQAFPFNSPLYLQAYQYWYNRTSPTQDRSPQAFAASYGLGR